MSEKQEKRKLTFSFFLFLFSLLQLPTNKQKTGGLQPRLHPDPAPLPAERIRQVPHLDVLRTLEDRGQGRDAGAAALRFGSSLLSGLLDPRPAESPLRGHGDGLYQGSIRSHRHQDRRRDRDAAAPGLIQYQKGQHVVCAAPSLLERHLKAAGSAGLPVDPARIVWTPYSAEREYAGYKQ